ncbi:MAG: type II CAAX endopeptidase family protein [Bacteroidetes bacterium]|nr:type II CAAX endopeptidase family protein [Bacteroidota bacterium]
MINDQSNLLDDRDEVGDVQHKETTDVDSQTDSSIFDGVSGNWSTFAVLSLWIIVGLVAYLFVGNLVSVLFLELRGVGLQDLISNQSNVLAEHGSVLLGANAVGLALGLGSIAFLASWLDSSRPLNYLRFRSCEIRDLILSCASFFCLLPIVLALGIVNDQLPLPEFLQRMEDQQMEIVEWLASGGGSFWLNLLFVALTPALFEEAFFRGFVQRRAERGMGIVGGILFTGVVFGIFHLRLTQVLPLAVLGCFLAYITWRTGSLLIPVVLHFLNNGLMLAISEWGSGSISDPETVPLPLIIAGAVGFLICVQFIHRRHEKKRRTEWVEVFRCGIDYEADIVYARLQDADIPAVILNQRDHAFNLTFGYLAKIKILVPSSMQKAASEIILQQPLNEDELTHEALKNE